MKDGVEHTVLYCQVLNEVRTKQTQREILMKYNVKRMVEIMQRIRQIGISLRSSLTAL